MMPVCKPVDNRTDFLKEKTAVKRFLYVTSHLKFPSLLLCLSALMVDGNFALLILLYLPLMRLQFLFSGLEKRIL